MSDPSESDVRPWAQPLSRLYADEGIADVADRIDNLLSNYRRAIDQSNQKALSESDVLLITYGDTLIDGETPPLQVLHRFHGDYLNGIFDLVRNLPFHPDSSDDGSAVIDYYTVREDLGDWNDIAAVVREYANLPVEVDNDSRAALLGKEAYGVLSSLTSGTENALMVALGTGIGVAARLNGERVRGAHQTGGLLSCHITIDINGPMCICRNRGCAEALVSGYALVKVTSERAWYAKSSLAGEERPNFRMLTDAVRKGDRYARQGLDEFCDAWTALLVSLIHAFGPAHVVISGGFTRSADLFLPGVLDAVRDRLWGPESTLDVHIAKEPELSEVRGGNLPIRRAMNEQS